MKKFIKTMFQTIACLMLPVYFFLIFYEESTSEDVLICDGEEIAVSLNIYSFENSPHYRIGTQSTYTPEPGSICQVVKRKRQ